MHRNWILDTAMLYVNKLLLPLEGFYYHQYNHSLEVMHRAIYLAEKEKLENNEIELLALAWLFHDSWFIIQYDNNEYIGAKIAKNYLKSILYPEESIAIIEQLITVTAPNKKPRNILEKIIKDADLDNLGRKDFFEQNQKMKQELETIKKIKLLNPDWTHASLALLKDYTFYTKTQQKERGETKIENRKILEKMIKNLDSDI